MTFLSLEMLKEGKTLITYGIFAVKKFKMKKKVIALNIFVDGFLKMSLPI